jgi:hypothetical protein
MARPKTNFKITVPEKWDDITLSKFIEIQSLYTEDHKPTYQELISVLSNIPIEEINNYPALVVEKVMEKLTFLSEPVSNEILNYIDYNGERYQINYMEDLKFGEFVDVQTILDSDRTNFPAILGIICRKDKEVYDDKFIAEILPKRIEFFSNLPVTKVYPLVGFFLNLSLLSEKNLESYLENLRDQANHTLQHYINSLKDGGGKKRSLKSAVKTLQKYQQQIKCI